MDNSRIKVAACGRRWGKTEAAAIDAATFAIAAPGSVQIIVAPTYDQSRLIFDTVERLVLGQPVSRGMCKVTRTPYPRLKIGRSLIMARTADEDGRNLRGHSADRVIVDEAAYVRDAVIEEVIGPMLADRNGQLVMISTPFGKNHFYRAFLEGRQPACLGDHGGSPRHPRPDTVGAGASASPAVGAGPCACPSEAEDPAGRDLQSLPAGRYSSFRFPSRENPFISQEYIEFQRGVLTPRQFAVEYEAEFLDDQTSVFGWGLIQSAVELGRDAAQMGRDSVMGRDFKSRPNERDSWLVAGIDWARYSDFTAVVVIDAGSVPHRVVAIDRFNRMSWEAQVNRAADILMRYRVNSVLTDQTSIGDPVLEQLRKTMWERGAGVQIDGFTFTNSSKREIIDNLVIRLSHEELAIPDDEQLIRELQYFEYELTAAGNVRMNARSGYTDDLVCALALAEWKARSHAGPAQYLASGRSRESMR